MVHFDFQNISYCLGSTVAQAILKYFCVDVCPYPYYGIYCNYMCSCSKKYCSHVKGCIPGKYNHHFNLIFWCNCNTIILREWTVATSFTCLKRQSVTLHITHEKTKNFQHRCLQWLVWPFFIQFQNLKVKNRDPLLTGRRHWLVKRKLPVLLQLHLYFLGWRSTWLMTNEYMVYWYHNMLIDSRWNM